ncbi:MAG TPA: rhodanese-like domain-containing protein, partial [Rhodospirillales bacterium]|nr:rhodanese-like domain-containing protein [Rhodospirillales bacterium]
SDFLIIAAIVIAGFAIMRFMPRMMAGVPFAEAREVHEMIQNGTDILIIDVRSESEFTGNLGHISGALNLEAADLKNRLAGGDGQFNELKGETVLVTCRTENRSPRVAKILTKAGFTNVCVLKGGMVGWNKQGLPVEK